MIMLFEQEEAVKRYGNSMRAEGIEEGRAEGMAKGQAKGFDLLGKLVNKLLLLGRNEDIQRAAADADYRDQLLEEFQLSE